MRMNRHLLYFLVIGTALVGTIFFFTKQPVKLSNKPVAQLSPTDKPIDPTTAPDVTPSLTPRPTVNLSKKSYVIALYGDSMIDTMSDVPQLLMTSLQNKYPGVSFTVYNYGIGAQNVADGLARFEAPFSNRDRVYPAITQLHPDVIVVGSFAYNPFSPHDRERHRALLTQLVEKAKQVAPTYMLAEIAPLGADFGKGTKGVNWPESQSVEHSNKIIEHLQNVFLIGQSMNVPVIDVFNKSKLQGAQYGQRAYVNVDDGIHPSFMGHSLMADAIVATINLK